MSELPHLWSAYEALQEQLARKCQIDHHAWGLEAGLNRLLMQPDGCPTQEDAARAVRSATRKERHRRKARGMYLVAAEFAGSPENVVAARERLRIAKARVTTEEWAFLCAVAEGQGYKEIAPDSPGAAGRLRVRVLRLRRQLAAAA